jgi:hypothetical protein
MKRSLLIALALALILVLAPAAAARTEYTSIDELEDGAVYTKEDMLAIYELGYRDGLAAAQEPEEGELYVINTKSGKFHLPSCKSVKDIKEKNRRDFTGTREEVIAQGYAPCGNCNP